MDCPISYKSWKFGLNVEVNDCVIGIEANPTFDTTRQIIYVGKGETRTENRTLENLLEDA